MTVKGLRRPTLLKIQQEGFYVCKHFIFKENRKEDGPGNDYQCQFMERPGIAGGQCGCSLQFSSKFNSFLIKLLVLVGSHDNDDIQLSIL